MSATVSAVRPAEDEPFGPEPEGREPAGREPVVVRRNAGLAALVGAAASAVAIAYLWRASSSGSPLDWAMCAILAAIAALYLAHLVDARTPLLVADDLGVRIRFAQQWRGLPWDAVREVVVQPRRGSLRDGRLVVSPHSVELALEGLDARGRRAARLNRSMYGAALAVPLGLTTRVSGRGDALAEQLEALARGRADLVVVRPPSDHAPADHAPADRASADHVPADHAPAAAATDPTEDGQDDGMLLLDGWPADRPQGTGSTAVQLDDPVRKPRGRRLAARVAPEDSADDEPLPVRRSRWAGARAVPLRRGRHQVRADIEPAAATLGNAALLPDSGDRSRHADLPESVELRRPDGTGLEHELGTDLADATASAHDRLGWGGGTAVADDRVRPIAELGDPVESLVVDERIPEPAADPVIGPELAAARTRVGLSVDELAERTRIRPHVIESIEVDDFAPCGGDFYARGHLRTLARMLGRDPGPLLAQFDLRYASAPINARRVFEAELATGMTGSMRSTVGGPNWALLVGVVVALVITWGVMRLFATEPTEVLRPAPALEAPAAAGAVDPSRPRADAAAAAPPPPIRVLLVGAATTSGSDVVVRDRSGQVVWVGTMTLGERKTVTAVPPVRVRASDAGAVDVSVEGVDQGAVGQPGRPGRRTFQAPAASTG